jgi:hypothetical protein
LAYPGHDPIPNQVPLELTDGGQHIEQQASGRRGRIDRLLEDGQVDAERLKVGPPLSPGFA